MRSIPLAILAHAFSPWWLDSETMASPTALGCGGYQWLRRCWVDLSALRSTISAFDDFCARPSLRPDSTVAENRRPLALHSLSRSGHHQFPSPLIRSRRPRPLGGPARVQTDLSPARMGRTRSRSEERRAGKECRSRL